MLNSFIFQYSFSYLVGGSVFATLAIFVFWKAPKENLNRLFALYCLCIAWWSFFSILMINAPDEALGIWWDRLCLMAVVFIPSTFMHFNYIFLGYDRRYFRVIKLNYLISVFFFMANFTPLFIEHTSPKFGLNYYTDPGPLYLPFVIYFLAISLYMVWILFFEQRRATGHYKKQLSLWFWAVLIGYAGVNYNLSFGVVPPILAALGNYGVAIYGIIVAYTITKHRLMDISVIISRTVAELLAAVFFAVIYFGFVWLYLDNISSSIDILFLACTFLFGFVLVYTYPKVRLFLQTSSDKLFLRGKYDYYYELSNLTTQITQALSTERILGTLQKVFIEVLEVSHPRIYLAQDFNKPEVKPWLELKEIKLEDNELIIPCLLEDRLMALIILGEKLSEDAFTAEDIQLLKSLASQAAVALDHTRTYEEIKKDYEFNQKKLYDIERALARSERSASLAGLLQEYNHEIKGPLFIILGETSLLTNQPRDAAYLEKFKKLISAQVARINDIVESTLRLSMPKEKENVPLDLNAVIEEALKLYPLSSLRVTKQFQPLPLIKGDKEDLELVFANLFKNAVDAMPQGGDLTIKTYVQGKMVCAEVSDTGAGILPENMEKIFEPFFSTHITKGRGLGLSIVFRIVREHLGKIKVASVPGRGATFILEFPAES